MKQSDVVQNFCKNIRLFRENSAFSMERMADVCGVDVPTLRKIESGRITTELALRVIARLHEKLGVSPSGLICDDIWIRQK